MRKLGEKSEGLNNLVDNSYKFKLIFGDKI